MKEKIKIWFKSNWLIVSLTILIIAMVAGTFYWYEWRPTQIRKNCYDSIITNPFSTELEQKSEFEYQYQDCLRKNGLEK